MSVSLAPVPLLIAMIRCFPFSVFHFAAIRDLRTTDVVEWGMADCRSDRRGVFSSLFCPAVLSASSPPQQSLVHSHSLLQTLSSSLRKPAKVCAQVHCYLYKAPHTATPHSALILFIYPIFTFLILSADISEPRLSIAQI